MQQPTIHTEHLILREMLAEDEDAMFELDANPEVMKYLGGRVNTDRQKIRDIIAYVRQQYVDNGIGRWTVVEKASGNVIGWSGLKLMRETLNGHTDFYDVGYRLLPQYWGKGYATESTLAALRHGFEEMSIAEIIGITNVGNMASRRVLTKAGLRHVEDFTYEGGPFDGTRCTWFSILKSEYEQG